MYYVQVDLRCVERLSEILLDDRPSAEDHLKILVQHILHEFFVGVTIESINIRFLPNTSEGLKCFSLHITARCTSETLPLSPQALERIELGVEDRISCTLLELVGGVDIEDISLQMSRQENLGSRALEGL